MKNKINVNQMMAASCKLHAEGQRFTHLGIGPMSKNLIRATLELAKEKDFPVLFIASRNQVDSDRFGGGYVCSFDQKRFVRAAEEIAEEIGFDGLCYFCRDHGGPWQRDKERNDKIPTAEAMEIAKQSYLDDIRDGFDLLHIDPTKDPHCTGVVPLDVVLDRTMELIDFVETERKKLGIGEIAYEVGTEETMGGLIGAEPFEGFIRALKERLAAKNYPMPVFVVGQTGTLTRMTSNVGHYDTPTAKTLSDICESYGTGLKEHNGDYLANRILLEHPVIGLAAMNVAPEFGLVETEAYFELVEIEKKFVPEKDRSRLHEVISDCAVKGERWRKWMVGDKRNATFEEISKSAEDVALIAKMCGHYTLEEPAVKAELAKMNANIRALGLDPDFYVIKKIKDSIDRYIYCFNLYGTTSQICAAAK